MRNRILFVDDDVNLLDSVQRTFRRSYECMVASNAVGAIDVLDSQDAFSIVVADLRMPGMDGLELLEHVRTRHPNTIRILLTGFADMNTAVEAINRCSVYSFLEKPFDTDSLKTVLKSANREYNRLFRLQMESLTDPLTGLYNRRFIEREFERQLDLSSRLNQKFSLVFGDINQFKEVNDTYGHLLGDEILKKIASVLSCTCRGSDMVSRFGGDEFVIVMESADSSQAERLCKRLDEAMTQISIKGVPRSSFSISLGYATYPDDSNNVEDLLETADQRMYERKQNMSSKLS